jgi:hypothetical protein
MPAKLDPVRRRSEDGAHPSYYSNHFRPKDHCKDCPDGAGLSLTIFFPGLGDDVVDHEFTYVPESQAAMAKLQRRLGERIDPTARKPGVAGPAAPPCCLQLLFAVELDPRRTVTENAQDVATELLGIVERSARSSSSSWIREICFHLIGFSAGGLVAIDTAKVASERLVARQGRCAWPREAGQTWCDRPAPSEIRVGFDVVTIATPYDGFVLEFLPELGLLFSCLAPDSRFFNSVGARDYGGGAKPACLRRFTAFVTREEDDDDAGGQLPGDQVEGWGATTTGVPGFSHLESLKGVMEERFARLIDLGCGCGG